MNIEQLPVYLFGEVLFDCFPDCEPQLGGAPFNVAWHLQAFGFAPQFISAIGDDELGRTIQRKMNDWGMTVQHLQQDRLHSTGQVTVEFEHNEPQYNILMNSAYDHIDSNGLPRIEHPHYFYHGTLAARCMESRKSLENMRQSAHQKTFIDVNLRAPWWEKDWVLEQIYAAHCVKLNLDELGQLTHSEADLENDWLALACDFKLKNNITNLIITRGASGACLINEEGNAIEPCTPAPLTQIVDTVGAGDAFSAVTLMGLILNWDWPTTLERAQNFAGFIVGQRGAISSNASIYRDFKCLWGIL